MAKARKLKTTKAERRTILKAAAKRKPKSLPSTRPPLLRGRAEAERPTKADQYSSASWKAGRTKRKPVSREAEPVVISRVRGPDLKPRKRRSQTMSTTNQKYEGGDIEAEEKAKADKADKAEKEVKAKAEAEADAKAYAAAEAKAKDEAKKANVPWTAWPKYGSTPTEAEAKARADAEAAAKARAEAAGETWTAWPKPTPTAEGDIPEGYVQVYDSSQGAMKLMKAP